MAVKGKAFLERLLDCDSHDSMTHAIFAQLEKVLALVDSSHDGEALGALRMARRMMKKENITFTDLAVAARKSQFSVTRGLFGNGGGGGQLQYETKIDQLHEEIQAHVEQNESLTSQIEFWRQRAFELEQMLNMNRGETERWKEMARETAERLWDLGQIARADAALSEVAFEDVEAAKTAPESEIKVAS